MGDGHSGVHINSLGLVWALSRENLSYVGFNPCYSAPEKRYKYDKKIFHIAISAKHCYFPACMGVNIKSVDLTDCRNMQVGSSC